MRQSSHQIEYLFTQATIHKHPYYQDIQCRLTINILAFIPEFQFLDLNLEEKSTKKILNFLFMFL